MWLAGNSGPFSLEILPIELPDLPTLRILHIADIHFAPGQAKKAKFLKELADTKPDLVVNTGDNLGHKSAINPLLNALEPLLGFPGVFVHGSNDYYAPKLKNPARYLLGPSKLDQSPQPLDTDRMTSEFEGAGWKNLNNASASMAIKGAELVFAGLDDPHINRDNAGAINVSGVDIAVVHAPYIRALTSLEGLGAKLILTGHTHGGQICLPGGKALVTNCDLPADQAQGLSRFGPAALHVSAGIGCSRFAPVRLFCPPKATLLEIN